MSKKIKLIWDFRGPGATQTATHHVIHLKEYMQLENLEFFACDMVIENELSAMAFLTVNEALVSKLRASLKPHRGQLAN